MGSPLAIGAAIGLMAVVLGGRPAFAADMENGESVFLGNCAACHAGGNNSVVAEKVLRKAAMEQYLTGGWNVDAIKTQVTNGKGSMPAFGDKLGPDDIDDVAAYVLDQSSGKWRLATLWPMPSGILQILRCLPVSASISVG